MTTPFICVFLALIMAYIVRIPSAIYMAKEMGGYDNAHPRIQQTQLEGWGARSHSAHLNCMEAFPAFAIAVVIAHLGHANAEWVSNLAIAFIITRVIFCILYLANYDKLRSLTWAAAFLILTAIFFAPAWAH